MVVGESSAPEVAKHEGEHPEYDLGLHGALVPHASTAAPSKNRRNHLEEQQHPWLCVLDAGEQQHAQQ